VRADLGKGVQAEARPTPQYDCAQTYWLPRRESPTRDRKSPACPCCHQVKPSDASGLGRRRRSEVAPERVVAPYRRTSRSGYESCSLSTRPTTSVVSADCLHGSESPAWRLESGDLKNVRAARRSLPRPPGHSGFRVWVVTGRCLVWLRKPLFTFYSVAVAAESVGITVFATANRGCPPRQCEPHSGHERKQPRKAPRWLVGSRSDRAACRSTAATARKRRG
jgi:hypothetical protein